MQMLDNTAQNQLQIVQIPETEVSTKYVRKKYTAAFKKRILDKLDQCSNAGDKGAILRQEGIYSSMVTRWRREFNTEGVAGLEPEKRGKKPLGNREYILQIRKLEHEKMKLEKKLKQAEMIIDIQKKMAGLLGLDPSDLSK